MYTPASHHTPPTQCFNHATPPHPTHTHTQGSKRWKAAVDEVLKANPATFGECPSRSGGGGGCKPKPMKTSGG